MSKRVFAVVGVMLMTTALALASASAFSLWGSEQKAPEASQIPPAAPVQPGASLPVPPKPVPAPAGAPEPAPAEKVGVITSFAPLVKHVMPTVVNVSVVQKVKGFGYEGGGDPISLATSPAAAMIPATEGIKADRKWVRR